MGVEVDIEGLGTVTFDDAFLDLTEEQRQAKVNYVARKHSAPAAAGPRAPAPASSDPGVGEAVGNAIARNLLSLGAGFDTQAAERINRGSRYLEDNEGWGLGDFLLSTVPGTPQSDAQFVRQVEDPEALARESLASAQRRNERRLEFPMTDAATEQMRELGAAEGWGDVWNTVRERPGATASLAGQVASEQLPTMAAAAALRSPTLAAGVMSGSNYFQERYGQLMQAAQERGYDLTNPEDAQAALQDESFLSDQAAKGRTRGAIIAAVDLLTMGYASRAMPTVGSFARQTGVQMAGGGAGEALAGLATGEGINPGEITLEALAEGVMAGPDAAIMTRGFLEQRRAAQAARGRRARDEPDPGADTLGTVAEEALAGDTEAEQFIRALGLDPGALSDQMRDRVADRLDERRAADAERLRYGEQRDPAEVEAERDAIEAGDMDPAAAPSFNRPRTPEPPEQINVPPRRDERPSRTGIDAPDLGTDPGLYASVTQQRAEDMEQSVRLDRARRVFERGLEPRGMPPLQRDEDYSTRRGEEISRGREQAAARRAAQARVREIPPERENTRRENMKAEAEGTFRMAEARRQRFEDTADAPDQPPTSQDPRPAGREGGRGDQTVSLLRTPDGEQPVQIAAELDDGSVVVVPMKTQTTGRRENQQLSLVLDEDAAPVRVPANMVGDVLRQGTFNPTRRQAQEFESARQPRTRLSPEDVRPRNTGGPRGQAGGDVATRQPRTQPPPESEIVDDGGPSTRPERERPAPEDATYADMGTGRTMLPGRGDAPARAEEAQGQAQIERDPPPKPLLGQEQADIDRRRTAPMQPRRARPQEAPGGMFDPDAELRGAPQGDTGIRRPETARELAEQDIRRLTADNPPSTNADVRRRERASGGRRPFTEFVRSQGGIRVGSDLHAELRARGIRAKDVPGLFRNGRGLRYADELSVDGVPGFGDLIGVDETGSYADRDAIVEALADEAGGTPRPYNYDMQNEADAASQEAEFRDYVDRLRDDSDFREAEIEKIAEERYGGAPEAEPETDALGNPVVTADRVRGEDRPSAAQLKQDARARREAETAAEAAPEAGPQVYTVKVSKRHFNDALERELDVGEIVGRTNRAYEVEATAAQLEELRADADHYGNGGADAEALTEQMGFGEATGLIKSARSNVKAADKALSEGPKRPGAGKPIGKPKSWPDGTTAQAYRMPDGERETEVRRPDGKTVRVARMSADEAMGLGGWHRVSEDPNAGTRGAWEIDQTWMGDTLNDAVEAFQRELADTAERISADMATPEGNPATGDAANIAARAEQRLKDEARTPDPAEDSLSPEDQANLRDMFSSDIPFSNPMFNPAAWRAMGSLMLGGVRSVRNRLKGSTAETPTARAAAMKRPKDNSTSVKVKDGLVSTIVNTMDGILRAHAKEAKSPTLDYLLDATWTRPGRAAKREGSTVEEAQTRRINRNTANYGHLTDGFSEAQKAKLVQALRGERNVQLTAEEDAAFRGLRAMFRNELAYMREAGVEIGEVPKDYFPREFDIDAVEADPDTFKKNAAKLYRQAGVPAKDADAKAASLVSAVLMGGETVDFQSDSAGTNFFQDRKFSRRADKPVAQGGLAEFMVNDLDYSMLRYLTRSARRAEIARVYGDKFSRKGEFDKKLRDEGVPDSVRDLLWQHVRQQAGLIEPARGSWYRALSTAHALTTMSLLEYATITSLPELVTPALRAGSTAEVFGELAAAVPNLVRYVGSMGTSKSDRMKAAYELSEFIGSIAGDTALSFNISRFHGSDQISRRQARWLGGYFRMIQLQQFTEYTRARSAMVGSRFITKMAAGLGGKSKLIPTGEAESALAELGVPEDKQADFAAFVDALGGEVPTPDQLTGEMGELFSSALFRFTDQSVMRPTPAVKPKWAVHPLGRVVFALQSFGYAFTKNVLYRQGNQLVKSAKAAREGRVLDAALYAGPVALLGATLPIMQFALGELRDLADEELTGREPRPMEQGAKIERALSRAGLFGAADPYLQSVSGTRYNKSPMETLAGPVFGLFGDATANVLRVATANSPESLNAERAAADGAFTIAEGAANAAFGRIPYTGIGLALALGVRGSQEDVLQGMFPTERTKGDFRPQKSLPGRIGDTITGKEDEPFALTADQYDAISESRRDVLKRKYGN